MVFILAAGITESFIFASGLMLMLSIGMALGMIFIDRLFYAKYYAVSLIIAKSRLTTTENQCCYDVNFSLTMPRFGHLFMPN